MLSDDMRKRIAGLNKGALRHRPKEPAPETGERAGPSKQRPSPEPIIRYRTPFRERTAAAQGSSPPETQDVRRAAAPSDAGSRVSIEEAAGGREIRNEAGRFLLIERSYQDFAPGEGRAFCRRYARKISSLEGAAVPHDVHGVLRPLLRAKPEDILYVDIEATGFTSSTPLFLVGALTFSQGHLRVQQLLARDYSEEAALLLCFSQMLQRSQVVISFNGKSYDLPYIRDRSAFFGVPFRLCPDHIDMVHEGRRRWKTRLPNCRLQTLERFICRRVRTGDIPGEEIPDAYHRFVRTGNAVQIRDILHHNALDLITMAQVLVFILEGRDL